MIIKIHALLLFFLALYKISTVQYAPTWLTSPYIDAGQYAIISTLTGSASTPSYQMMFTTPFSSIPNAGYGIS